MDNIEYIINHMKNIYEKHTKSDFHSFYTVAVANINEAANREDLLIKTIRPAKKRWLNKIKKDINSTFNKDLQSVQIQYNKVLEKEIEVDKFRFFFNALNYDEYREKLLAELNEWVDDDEKYLSTFKYIDDLNVKSIIFAIKNDIYLSFIDSHRPSLKIQKVPNILSDLPIDTTGRIGYLSESQKSDLDNNFNISTLDRLVSLEGDEQDEILFKLEKDTYLEIKKGGNPDKYLDMMTQIALLKSIKYLNSVDTKVIIYYYNHFDHLLTGTPIDKSLYEILKDLGFPNTTQYYDTIENSLAKLGSINMMYKVEGNKLYGNLLACFMYKENDVKRAKVYLGAILQNLVLKNGAFEYDKDTFNNLSNNAQQIATWLQKRRYRLAMDKRGNDESIGLNMFSNAIYFNDKRKDKRRGKVMDALNELSYVGLIVEKFSYVAKFDVFNIKYYDLSFQEKKKVGIIDEESIETDVKKQIE